MKDIQFGEPTLSGMRLLKTSARSAEFFDLRWNVSSDADSFAESSADPNTDLQESRPLVPPSVPTTSLKNSAVLVVPTTSGTT